MRRRGKTILWPQYFDIQRSCSRGRKLKKAEAITLPNLKELMEASIELGYEIDIEPSAKYPKTWWDPPGFLLINMMGQKRMKVMEKIAQKVKTMRIKKKQEEASSQGKKKKKHGKR